MVRLKSGHNLTGGQLGSQETGLSLLVFSEFRTIELFANSRHVYPEAPLPAYRAGPFNGEAYAVGRIAWWWQIDVPSRYVWAAIVVQWEEVEFRCRGRHFRCRGREGREALDSVGALDHGKDMWMSGNASGVRSR